MDNQLFLLFSLIIFRYFCVIILFQMNKAIIILFLEIIAFQLYSQETDWSTYYEESGGVATPDYVQTIAYCQKLAGASSWIEYTTFGVSPQGRDLPLLIIDKNGNFTPQEVKRSGNAVLFIEAGIHSGEIEGKDAMLMLLRDLAIRKKNTHLLDHVTILFIPIFNVDGHERSGPYNRINQNGPVEMGWRTTATNLNLNRDFLKTDQPEMIAWHKLFQKWLPDFFIDVHTTDGADYQYVLTYAMEIYGNMDAGLTQWVKDDYLPEMISEMEDAGFPVFEYVAFRQWFDPRSGLRTDAAPPRLSQGYVALQNRPGLLVETHMLKPYKLRVESTYEIIMITLDILNKDYQELIKLNHQADAVAASDMFRESPLAVKFKRSDTDSVMVDFRGVEYDIETSQLTGGNWYRYQPGNPVTFKLPMFNTIAADKTVRLPVAYIIPTEWIEVINRLKLHGVNFIPLAEETEIEVETYRFVNPSWQNSPFEGRFPMQNIEFEIITDKVLFPEGSVVVPVNQRAIRVIANILEPLAEDSYVYWGFFNPVFERKEYFETYVMEEKAREMIKEDPQLLEEYNRFKNENPQLEGNQWGLLWWFYQRSPYYDQRLNVYPVGRITSKNTLNSLPLAR